MSGLIPELRTPVLATMLTDVAVCLAIQYRLEEAATLHRQAIELAIAGWGPNHPQTFSYQCNLAQTLQTQEKLREAKVTYQRVWQYLESSAPHTEEWEDLRIHVPDWLAPILSSEGKDDEAEEMQEHAYNAVLAIRGEDHSDTLCIMGNRAAMLSSNGKFAEAELMGRKVVERQLQSLGLIRRATLNSMKSLAIFLRGQGKFSEAREWIDHIFAVERKLFPVGHPDRLATAKELGLLFFMQKDYPSAERELRQAQSDDEAFPHKTYVLLNLQSDLVMVLDAHGKHVEAEAIVRKVLASRPNLASSLDADTSNIMQLLATILCHIHQEKEAEDLQWQILEHYGDDGRPHHKRLSKYACTALSAIITILEGDQELEPIEQCERILQLQDQQRIGGTKAFQNRVKLLSLILSKLGCHTESIELRAKWRHMDDDSSLWLVNKIAVTYILQNREAEAKDVLIPLITDAERLFGLKDSLTLSSTGLLAIAVGLSTDRGIALLRNVTANAEPDNIAALSAWHNLGVGYEWRNMGLEAFKAFRTASELAREHFERSEEPMVMQVRKSFEQFLEEHGEEGPVRGILTLRFRRPVARVTEEGYGDEGSDRDAGEGRETASA